MTYSKHYREQEFWNGCHGLYMETWDQWVNQGTKKVKKATERQYRMAHNIFVGRKTLFSLYFLTQNVCLRKIMDIIVKHFLVRLPNEPQILVCLRSQHSLRRPWRKMRINYLFICWPNCLWGIKIGYAGCKLMRRRKKTTLIDSSIKAAKRTTNTAYMSSND